MNSLYYGDNLEVLRTRIATESVDLVYLDPPFNSNRSYNVLFKTRSGDESQAQQHAFDDTWTWSQQSEGTYRELVEGGAPLRVAEALEAMRRLLGDNDVLAYLVMMTARMIELHRVLKPTGSLYLHCDPTASHYLKVLLDAVFGPTHFRNEVIWKRASTVKGNFGQGSKLWGQATDTLLFYTKTDAYTFHQPFTDYSQGYVDTAYRHIEPGTGRRYRLVSMIGPGGAAKGNPRYEVLGVTKYWRYSRERMQQLIDAGLVVQTKPGGVPHRKYYLDEGKGVPVQSLWDDIGNLQASDGERLGYPTQKPLALLERIIGSSTDEGDVVLDPFCGCGTTIDAAQKLRRGWIGIDVSYLAIDLIEKRLRHTYGDDITNTYEVLGIPQDLDGARALFQKNPFDFERWAVGQVDGQSNEKQVGDKGADGIIRFPIGHDTGRIVVSVKGGKNLNPAMVRDLAGSLRRQGAEMGILITMDSSTRGVRDEVNHSGTYEHPTTGTSYPRVQVVTVAELLAGKRPAMPTAILPYVKARARPPAQPTLGL